VRAAAEEAIAAAERWRSDSTIPPSRAERRLDALLGVPGGTAFAIGLVDGVLRPQDARVVARNLEVLSRSVPVGIRSDVDFLTHTSAGLATLAPAAVAAAAREGVLRYFSHLLLRLDARELEEQISQLTARGGIRPSLHPLLAAASGQREADKNAEDVRDLLLKDGVESVSVPLPAVTGFWRMADLDGVVADAADRVARLCEVTGQEPNATLILEITTFDQLEPTLRVFEFVAPRFPHSRIGISLPANLPDSLSALRRVVHVSRARRAGGGTAVTVRIAMGDHAEDERALAADHGWANASFSTREEADAHYLRMLDFALDPVHGGAVQVVSATQDLMIAAFAWRLARVRKVEKVLEHEFPLGIATRAVEVAKRDLGGVRVQSPVILSGQLPLAAPYLVRSIRRQLSPDKPAASTGARTAAGLRRAREERFRSIIELSRNAVADTFRNQNLIRIEVADFSQAPTREWALGVLEHARDSAAGEAFLERSAVENVAALDSRLNSAIESGVQWSERRGSTRGAVLESVSETFAEWRGRLVEVAVSESGLSIEDADSDVTAAIALASSAARNARELDGAEGATFVPPRLLVAVAPRIGALVSLAGTVLSALAAGCPVVIKPAPESRRNCAVFVETLIAGGVPEGLVQLVDTESELSRVLLCDERVDRVVHSGSRHAAKLFHSWRAEMVLSSTTGGRNSMIVTPSADLEAAVADILSSAFDHGGQAPTSMGALILVGSAGGSSRFLGRLTDAVSSLPTGRPGSIGAGLSALARPAGTRELETLESLFEGESWRVRPRKLDRAGRLWSPGLRDGVQPAALFRRPERRAPVLDLVRVATLEEAIGVQNAHGFGLSAAIHSLDPSEVETWLDSVEAGLLCVNRSVVTTLADRVPIGGWNRSILGPSRAAGGQDSAISLGSWEPVAPRPGSTVTLDGVGPDVARFIAAAQPGMNFSEFDWVRTSARSDEAAWLRVYAARHVAIGAEPPEHPLREFAELAVQRYRALAVTIRLSEGARLVELVRVLAAATRTGAPVAVSSAVPLHPGLIALFGAFDSPVQVAQVLVESDARWRARVQAGEILTTRIRLIGGDPVVLARVLHGQSGITVLSGPVTTSGRVELLPFLREQSICVGRFRPGLPPMDLSEAAFD
jgi:RHH-type proline utilization regulon transcriptional repressor/proline dehydrogenase/delta 1-pyrroline-5-carboxylate dehydrogenase